MADALEKVSTREALTEAFREHGADDLIPESAQQEFPAEPADKAAPEADTKAEKPEKIAKTDTKPGDTIESIVWYQSFHPFWKIQQSFGIVRLPAKP